MTKRTFGGTSRKRKRVSGFRVRMRSHTGRRVIKSRRQKGRERPRSAYEPGMSIAMRK